MFIDLGGMGMSEVSEQQSSINPLWIISLFLGLAEVCVTTSATITSGITQVVLAVSSVVYGLGVAVMFFAVLWTRNHVLYAPRDYTTSSSPAEFVSAMRTHSISERIRVFDQEVRTRDAATDRAVRDSTLQLVEDLRRSSSNDDWDSDRAHQAANVVVHNVRAARSLSEITVSFEGIGHGHKDDLVVTINSETTVQQLVNRIYYVIEDFIPPSTFGRTWVLEDSDSRHRYTELGSGWTKDPKQVDTRRLEEAGLRPGMRLKAVLL